MILLEKRAHLVLETPLGVVRPLPIDITHQCPDVRRTHGKQRIPALPREIPNALLLHPNGRPRFDLGHDLCRRSGRRQPHRKMNVVGNASHAKTFAIQFARDASKIRMKAGTDIVIDRRQPVFRAEHNMHQVETQRLRHGGDYMSCLQPSPVSADTYLGLRPRLVCVAPLALSPCLRTHLGLRPGLRTGPVCFGLSALRSGCVADLGLRPRLVCRRAFGPHILGQRKITNSRSRTTPSPKLSQQISAIGATTYQPRPEA